MTKVTFPLDPERLFTIKEVADLEQASVRTIRRWIKSGELPALRTGRLVRIRPKDLETWRQRRLLGRLT